MIHDPSTYITVKGKINTKQILLNRWIRQMGTARTVADKLCVRPACPEKAVLGVSGDWRCRSVIETSRQLLVLS